MEVNVLGQLAVIQAMLPLLRRKQGRIVSIGSTSGRFAGRMVGAYCASKAALDAIGRTLQLELRSAGIRVSIVEPGVVATPFWQKTLAAEDESAGRLPAAGRMIYAAELTRRREALTALQSAGCSPDEVAAAVAHALTSSRPRLRYVVGRDAKVRIAIARVLPEFVWQWLASR